MVVDSYSKWPEIIPTKSINANTTINLLRGIFATHGIPEQIVSDNGTQFTSSEFKSFTSKLGIHHTFSAARHPSTNGEVERFIQTFKKNMRCRKLEGTDFMQNLQSFCFAFV